MELRAADIIDGEIGGHYGFFSLVEQISTRPHQHDFFEIFLIKKGSIQHHVNDETVLLSAGHIVFIRPNDAHYYCQHEQQNCELLNIAFLRTIQADVCAFLGDAICQPLLLQPALPPTGRVSQQDLKSVVRQLEQWGHSLYQDKAQSRLALKGMVAQLLARYLLNPIGTGDNPLPAWLEFVYREMQEREHIIEGREALLRLASRTPEYVGRSFKQYLGITPSQFINDLRLDYAAELLLQTDQSPTDICYEVGFGNLSHFYHLFKARWDCSPNEYRKQHHDALVPR